MSSAHHPDSLISHLTCEKMNIPITPKASKSVTKSWIIKESTVLLLLGFPHLVVKILSFPYESFRNLLLAVARNSLGSAPNVLLTPENSRDFMQVPARAWAMGGEERELKAKGFFL
jgi:hypothetical protein